MAASISLKELKYIAGDPGTSPEKLRELMHINSLEIKKLVASNTSSPPDVLRTLQVDGFDNALRKAVALNKSSPPDLLHLMALSYDKDVRCAIAANPSAGVETLKRLADDLPEVRKAVAGNPSTPSELLHRMFYYAQNADHLDDVQASIASNPNTPLQLLIELLLMQSIENKSVTNAISMIAMATLKRVDYGSWEDGVKQGVVRLSAYYKTRIGSMSLADALLGENMFDVYQTIQSIELAHDLKLSYQPNGIVHQKNTRRL